MAKYRKKSVEIEAIQLTTENWQDVYDFLGVGSGSDGAVVGIQSSPGEIEIIIETPEGDMTARQGDYIVKTQDGVFYPRERDLWEKVMEIVVD